MEDDFAKKAIARYRRQWPKTLEDGISTSRSRASTSGPSMMSSRPSTAPEFDAVESKYLFLARVPYGPKTGPGSPALRPFKLLPERPFTAPEQLNSPRLVNKSIESVAVAVEIMEIVESPTSFTVQTDKGPQKIPRHHWIALEPETAGALSNADSFAGRRLLAALGGGTISEKGSELVRLVPEERLHLVAAEANFKRASHSTSVLTLRHAACALQLLRERDKEVQTGAMSVPLQSCPSSMAHLDSKTAARVASVARVVGTAAKAKQKRVDNQRMAKLMSHQPRQVSKEGRLLKGNKLLEQGVICLEEFDSFVQSRYGNAVRVWFALDPEENMKLGERMFTSRAMELGFRGNISAMYKYIDSDRTGSVTILELDSYAATKLAGFKKFLYDHFDGCPDAFLHRADRNRGGRVTKNDMVSCCRKLHYDGSDCDVAELFDLLDRRGLGNIVANDVKWLLKWKARPYLFAKPDFEALKQVREGFCLVNGMPLYRSWRQVLDVDCSMRVSWDEFVRACKKMARQVAAKAPGHTVPKTDEEIAAAWRAVDVDCSGWIALKEFDLPCYQALKAFKQWAVKEFGGVFTAMKKLDGNGNGRLAAWELKKSETRPDGYPGDVDELFDFLDLLGQNALGESEVKFLDEWDIAWEEYEESAGLRRSTDRARARNLCKPHGDQVVESGLENGAAAGSCSDSRRSRDA